MRGLLAAAAAAAVAATYDDSEGNAFAYLSAAAYCDAGPVDSWSCAACTQGPISLSSVDFIQDSEQTTFGYSGLDSSGVAYFAWRGSADIEMWINNLKFDTTPFPGCSGFYEDYTSMSSQLISALDGINSANAPYLALSGHSLGAAQANLAAFELALAGYPVAVVYNFGQPRVGDPTYAASFIDMIINGQDSVSSTTTSTATGTAAAPRSLLRTHKHAPHRRAGAGANHTVHSVAPHRLNAAVFANPAVPEALLSHVMAKAIARAVGHPINSGVVSDAAEAAALVARVVEHATASTAHVAMKKAAAKRGLNVTRSAQVSRTPYTARQLEILAALRFPLAEYRLDAAASAAIGGPSVTEMPLREALATLPAASKLGGFSGTQFYRVVHWQDIVPHVPPESFGFTHAVEEAWYSEDFSSYTACSTTNGEDPNCSDSVGLPISVSDHLHYFNIAISDLC